MILRIPSGNQECNTVTGFSGKGVRRSVSFPSSSFVLVPAVYPEPGAAASVLYFGGPGIVACSGPKYYEISGSSAPDLCRGPDTVGPVPQPCARICAAFAVRLLSLSHPNTTKASRPYRAGPNSNRHGRTAICVEECDLF